MNFIDVSNAIFNKKYLYKDVSDKDKEDSFYMINKKLYISNPKLSQFLNHEYIDRASALDLYSILYRKQNSPPNSWWAKSTNTKETTTKAKKSDKEMLIEYEGLSEQEFEFLYEHYQEDVDYKIKLLNRLV
jgi:hypothetical protein